jgi:hypothetical protein
MNIKLVAERTFNLLKGFGYEVSSYNKEGDLVIDPMEATRFAVESPNILVRIDPHDKHLSLKTGTPGESIEKIRPMLKELAQDYLLDFDYSVFDKQIKPKGEKVDVAKKSKEDGIMSEDMKILMKLAGLEENTKDNCTACDKDMADCNCELCDDCDAKGCDNCDDGKIAEASIDEVEMPLKNPPGSKFKFGQDSNQKINFNSPAQDMAQFYLEVGKLFGNDPMIFPKSPADKPMAATIIAKAYQLHKINGEDPKSAIVQAKQTMQLGFDRDQSMPINDESVQMEASTKTVNGCTVYSDGSPLSFSDWRKETEMETGHPMKRSAEDQQMDYNSYVNRCKAGSNISEASLGKMTGSRKSSYQPLADNVKIIVRHNKDVNEEVRGARSRNIHSILIQRGEEKFKMAENNLSAARAMARHLHNGGETFDEIGEAITEMTREFTKLKEFVGYVRKANLVNEENQEFVSLAIENINNIKTTFKRLSGVKSYVNAVESVRDYNNVELLQDDLDLESRFTETHFDDKVANAMDSLKAMSSRKNSFESKIKTAIESETFAGIKNMLAEDDVMEFENLSQQLGHKVSTLGNTAKDETLGNYLHSISNKLNAGGQLSQFEYGAVKSCLLSAGQHNVQPSAPMSMEESYEAFMDRFVD